MTALGEILELLHDASERGRPATLTADEWRHGPRSSAAFERFMAQRFPTASGGVHATGEGAPDRDESTWTTTLAFESPERFREASAGRQAGKRYLVRDGGRWLPWDADWGTATHETESEHGGPSCRRTRSCSTRSPWSPRCGSSLGGRRRSPVARR